MFIWSKNNSIWGQTKEKPAKSCHIRYSLEELLDQGADEGDDWCSCSCPGSHLDDLITFDILARFTSCSLQPTSARQASVTGGPASQKKRKEKESAAGKKEFATFSSLLQEEEDCFNHDGHFLEQHKVHHRM